MGRNYGRLDQRQLFEPLDLLKTDHSNDFHQRRIHGPVPLKIPSLGARCRSKTIFSKFIPFFVFEID